MQSPVFFPVIIQCTCQQIKDGIHSQLIQERVFTIICLTYFYRVISHTPTNAEQAKPDTNCTCYQHSYPAQQTYLWCSLFCPTIEIGCKGRSSPNKYHDRQEPEEYRKIVRRLPKHQTSCCTAIAEPIINRRINRFEEIFKIWNIGSSDNKRYRIKTTKINRCRPKQPFSGVVTKSGYPQNNQREQQDITSYYIVKPESAEESTGLQKNISLYFCRELIVNGTEQCEPENKENEESCHVYG